MQILLGMILGVLITVCAAFVYDSTGQQTVTAEGHAPMVNWDVVSQPRLGRA